MLGWIRGFVMIKRIFSAYPLMFWGIAFICLMVLVALTAQWIAPYDPIQQNLTGNLLPPSIHHWMGTDQFGRDVLSRLIYGSRVSLAVGIVAVSIYIFIGTLVGSVAGYYGGWVDGVLMRLVDILLCIPTFYIILMVIAFVGPNIINIMVIIGVTSWTDVARLVRGEILALKEREFIQAARVIGMKDSRIILKHLLPNALGPVLVVATLGIGSTILLESALSFLGLGVQPPTPSWGNMLEEGKDHLTDAWWLITFPGIAIFLTVMAYSFLGEGLRDYLDPRYKVFAPSTKKPFDPKDIISRLRRRVGS
jgi:peptide/nickel transport system permease protein